VHSRRAREQSALTARNPAAALVATTRQPSVFAAMPAFDYSACAPTTKTGRPP
jgi:hypothetical protein